MTSPAFDDFAGFRAALTATDGDPGLARTGRRCLILNGEDAFRDSHINRLEQDLQAYAGERDFWRGQSEGTVVWRLVRLAQKAYSHFFRSS